MQRQNLSAEVASTVRGLITDGRLPPGERINEVRLADRLAVSRTPIREALSRLASEGLVTVAPRRGFFVQRLSPAEVEQLYTIRAILDPAALELAGLPGRPRLERLERLNRRLRESTTDPAAVVEVDNRWHLTLLEQCPNPILLDLIRRFMGRTRPLELRYMRANAHVERAVAEHGRIIEACRNEDLRRAVEALRRNMRSAVPPLIEWLEGTRNEETSDA